MPIAFISRHWSVAAGILLGLILVPVVADEYGSWRMERRLITERGSPVVEASATIVARDETAVLLHIKGVKLRDCKLVGTQAFSVRNSVMLAARMERSGPVPIDSIPRPLGPFDMGEVRVWPVGPDADAVVLYALHTCGAMNIEVRSTIARVDLNARN